MRFTEKVTNQKEIKEGIKLSNCGDFIYDKGDHKKFRKCLNQSFCLTKLQN